MGTMESKWTIQISALAGFGGMCRDLVNTTRGEVVAGLARIVLVPMARTLIPRIRWSPQVTPLALFRATGVNGR